MISSTRRKGPTFAAFLSSVVFEVVAMSVLSVAAVAVATSAADRPCTIRSGSE